MAATGQETPLEHIYRWDLDKTYLDTDLRLRYLWRVPFEKASDKRNVPGVVALIRELSNADSQGGRTQVTFISGSPHQMRRKIEEKFRLDGLAPDGLFLKPNLRNFFQLRWRAIREQVGYKLPLLLEARTRVAPTIHETCFGDDSESDAFIYSLYADVVRGEVGDFTLKSLMGAAGAYKDAILRAREARRLIAPGPMVDAIFIHLAMRSDPKRFTAYGPRVIPVYDYFQAALVLYARGRLTARGVVNIVHEMVVSYGFDAPRVGRSFQDILRRGFVTREQARKLHEEVAEVTFPDALPPRSEFIELLRKQVAHLPEDMQPPPGPIHIDYPRLVGAIRERVTLGVQAGEIASLAEDDEDVLSANDEAIDDTLEGI